MILEPFLYRVRKNKGIMGVGIGSREHKVSAYADDLIFYLFKPQEFIPALMLEVQISAMATFMQNNFPFIWNTESLYYLGVHITADAKLLYELNYGSLMTEIIRDLHRWKGHFLTWFGRVNVLKINIMHRIIYILYTVPILLPQIFFKRIRKAFISIIWNVGNSRIAYDILRRNKKGWGNWATRHCPILQGNVFGTHPKLVP